MAESLAAQANEAKQKENMRTDMFINEEMDKMRRKRPSWFQNVPDQGFQNGGNTQYEKVPVAVHSNKESNNGENVKLIGPITIHLDDKKEKKMKRQENRERPPSTEWKYLYAQSELVRKGIPLDIEVYHTVDEDNPFRIPYPTDLYFQRQLEEMRKDPHFREPEAQPPRRVETPEPMSHEEVMEKLAKLPKPIEGEQSTFLPNTNEMYPGQEIEYRFIVLNGWLEYSGNGTSCEAIRPQCNVPEEMAQSLGAVADLQFVHDTYPNLKPIWKYDPIKTSGDQRTPEQKYQDDLAAYKRAMKEWRKKKYARHRRTARNMAVGLLKCITM